MEMAATGTRAIEIIPSGEALGAEIRGVDMASGMSDAEVDQIKDAWREHLVLVFCDQYLDDGQPITAPAF